MIDAPVRLAYRAAHRVLRAYWYLRRPDTHGALVAVWHEGKVLLVKNSYRAFYSLPGGYLRRGEAARDAATRELHEELGLRVSSDALVHAYHGTHAFENRGDTVDIFELHLPQPPTFRVDGREVVWAGLCSPREALTMPVVPHLVDYFKDR